MKILLSNDDGIDAAGLTALQSALKRFAEVTVCAPEHQRSAVSNSITLYEPLIVRKFERTGSVFHAVRGTPSDAVKLAILELLPKKPDLVVSGINNGLNTGSNILYSGTVAAALEASQFEIPSFAVSLESGSRPDFAMAARVAVPLIRKLYRAYPKTSTVFNINVPARRPRGVLVTVQEHTPYQDAYDRRKDPRGRHYYWLMGTPERRYNSDLMNNGKARVPTDAWALAQGYMSITPLRRDLTHHPMLEELQKLTRRRS